ncbi:MAG: hypothetical protein ACFFDP_09485 [Promethearchaeota archaeon]
MGTATGTIAGLLSTLALAYGIVYAASMGLLTLTGAGMIPTWITVGFTAESWQIQLELVLSGILLDVVGVYILASLIWLVGGLISGMIIRDAVKGIAASLITGVIIAVICWIIAWYNAFGFDFVSLLDEALIALVLGWIVNGILGGIIAAIGGVVGGTLTSQKETR